MGWEAARTLPPIWVAASAAPAIMDDVPNWLICVNWRTDLCGGIQPGSGSLDAGNA
jgi:hypothetical protein